MVAGDGGEAEEEEVGGGEGVRGGEGAPVHTGLRPTRKSIGESC